MRSSGRAVLASVIGRLWPVDERTAARGSCALLALVVISGCASGPPFVAPEPPAAGRAAVYVYREAKILGAGVVHDVWVGTRPVGKMVNGGYKRIEAAAGTVLVSAPKCEPASAAGRLGSGEVGYVQLALVNRTVEMGGRYYWDYGCRLTARSEAEALAVLPGLRLVAD